MVKIKPNGDSKFPQKLKKKKKKVVAVDSAHSTATIRLQHNCNIAKQYQISPNSTFYY